MTTATTTAKTIKPTGTRLLVKRDDAKDKTKGGIVIPDKSKDKPRLGTVIEVGPGKELDNGKFVKPQVKAGDRILFSEYAGTEVKLNNVSHLIIDDGDVLAEIVGDGLLE